MVIGTSICAPAESVYDALQAPRTSSQKVCMLTTSRWRRQFSCRSIFLEKIVPKMSNSESGFCTWKGGSRYDLQQQHFVVPEFLSFSYGSHHAPNCLKIKSICLLLLLLFWTTSLWCLEKETGSTHSAPDMDVCQQQADPSKTASSSMGEAPAKPCNPLKTQFPSFNSDTSWEWDSFPDNFDPGTSGFFLLDDPPSGRKEPLRVFYHIPSTWSKEA